jgi:hypothetical protein
MGNGQLLPGSVAACPSSAWRNAGGNSRPLFAARRRIPRAAFGLKKYLGGTAPPSRIADKEHTPAPLGNSEILSVKHAPAGAADGADADPGASPAAGRDGRRPAGEASEDGGEVGPPVLGEKTRDVLEQNPTGSERISDSGEVKEQTASLSIQASTASSHAPVLTRDSTDHKVNWSEAGRVKRLDVFMAWNSRPSAGEHAAGVRINFALPLNAEAGPLQAKVK